MQVRINPAKLNIAQMHDIAMRYIFDRSNVKKEEMIALENSIDVYSKMIDLNNGDKWEVRRIVNALIADEHGHFDRAKGLLIEHKIHYRQLYKAGLPFIDAENRKFWNKS